MRAVFFVFLLGYGFLTALAWDRARKAFPVLDRRVPSAFGAAFILFMTFGPVAARVADGRGLHGTALWMLRLTDPWWAVILWFTLLVLIVAGWNGLVRTVGFWRPSLRGLAIGPRREFLLCAGVVACLCFRGVSEANGLHVRTVHLRTPRLPAGSAPVRIAHLTDAHLGPWWGENRVRTVEAILRAWKADLLVTTGDILDGGRIGEAPLGLLVETLVPLGAVAIPGNHEYYAGIRACIGTYEGAGFRVLRDESLDVKRDGQVVLRAVGMDDPARRQDGLPRPPPESALLPDADTERPFTLLLKHRPVVDPAAVGRFDLQLSGHTHGGQIWPFGRVVRDVYGFDTGLHNLGKGSLLYVSPGAGTWGPPMRFLQPAEITLFVLEAARQ
jgi:predicted MPP superfamily phosphohydrolase